MLWCKNKNVFTAAWPGKHSYFLKNASYGIVATFGTSVENSWYSIGYFIDMMSLDWIFLTLVCVWDSCEFGIVMNENVFLEDRSHTNPRAERKSSASYVHFHTEIVLRQILVCPIRFYGLVSRLKTFDKTIYLFRCDYVAKKCLSYI